MAQRGLRVAVIGAGLMGRWHAYYALRSGASIAAVVDRSPEAAQQFCSRFPGAAPFADLEQMLLQVRPSIVHICTPSATHWAVAGAVIDGGAHLLIEKPLMPTVSESEALFDRAEQRGVMICPV